MRGNRGQAFWRGGDGYSIALDTRKGIWYDHAAGEGGDVIALVEAVRGCDFREALAWLSDFTGMSLPDSPHRCGNHADADWATDLKCATWWKIAAEALAEHALATMESWNLQRRGPTVLLQTIRLGEAALVSEYRTWRRRDPALTAAMVHAGQRSDARLQRRLALWVRSHLDETAA